MKLIKADVGFEMSGKNMYSTSLFFCPVCKKTVERKNSVGRMQRTCSAICAAKLKNRYQSNPCLDCKVDDCDWLLNGKRIKGWKAIKVPYPGIIKFSTTYKIAFCPNFKQA